MKLHTQGGNLTTNLRYIKFLTYLNLAQQKILKWKYNDDDSF